MRGEAGFGGEVRFWDWFCAGPEDTHIHPSRPALGLARSCWKPPGPDRCICINSGPLMGAGIYTYTPVWPQRSPTRPGQAEDRPGPVYLYILRLNSFRSLLLRDDRPRPPPCLRRAGLNS